MSNDAPKSSKDRNAPAAPNDRSMSFRITGLSADQFRHLFGLPEAALAAQGIKRYRVDAKPGFPDRVGLRDLEPGETASLRTTPTSRPTRPIAPATRSSSAQAISPASMPWTRSPT